MIRTTHKDPRSRIWPHFGAIRHRELDVQRKVRDIPNRLLDGQVAQTRLVEVREGVGLSEEAMFEDDCGALVLLGEVTSEGTVRHGAVEILQGSCRKGSTGFSIIAMVRGTRETYTPMGR